MKKTLITKISEELPKEIKNFISGSPIYLYPGILPSARIIFPLKYTPPK